MTTSRSSAEWDAAAYHRLGRPQLEWGLAVLDSVAWRGDEVVLDAGCGSGRLTGEILTRVPRGQVLGVDRSSNMVSGARQHVAELRSLPGPRGRASFVQADLVALPFARAADAVFSTATFHWIHDHARLFRSLYVALRPRGRLVAQCGGGRNLERVHARALRLMQSAAFADVFRGWSDPWNFATPEATAERLHAAGFVDVATGLTPAPTVLRDRSEYVEFLATVVVRTHLQCLEEEQGSRFLAALADAAASDDPPFSLDYWRLNLRATRPA